MDFYKVLDQTVREIKREVNIKVLKVPEIEQKVLDATSNEAWGPHGTLMAEIAQATRNFNESQMVMAVLWKRIGDTGKDWRHVYKALTVLEYLVANGSERVVDELLEHTFQISTLSDFQYIEPNGKDQGINVRKKAQNILALINDKDKIREVRQKASANRDKYGGLSSTGGYKPSSYSSFGGGFDGDRYDDDRFGSRNGSKYDDSDKQKNSYRVQDRYDQGRSDKSADNYEDDDFARIRDHDDDRAQGTTIEVSNSSQNQAAARVAQIGAMDSANDDFNPRGSSKPVAAPPVTSLIDDDVFGQSSAGKNPNIMKVIPPPPPSAGNVPSSAAISASSSATDLFAHASFNATFVAPSPSPTYSLNKSPVDTLFPPSEDLFAAQTSNTASSAALGINEGSSMFEAAPSKSNSTTNGFGNADPFDGFGDFVTSQASEHRSMIENQSQSLPPTVAQHSNTAGATKSQRQKEKFEPKSSIWADSLSRGLIDLNISAPKSVNLSDIGINLDFPSSEKKVEERKTYTLSKGKAMGSGSGLGLAGASTLAATASATMGAYNTGVGSGGGVMMGHGAGVNVMGMEPSMNMPQSTGSGYATNFSVGTGQGGLASQQQQFGGFR